MKEMTYEVPATAEDAVAAVTGDDRARFLGGGSNLVDHLKLGISTPERLVDISRLPLDDIEETESGLRIGTNVRNSDLAADPLVRRGWPGVSRALLSGPDGQRRIPIGDLHTLPGDRPDVETTLAHGELITAVDLPASPLARRSTYYELGRMAR